MQQVKTGWLVTVNVLPIDDLIAHEASLDCVCGPREDNYGYGVIFVHNSLDGREEHEEENQTTEEDD